MATRKPRPTRPVVEPAPPASKTAQTLLWRLARVADTLIDGIKLMIEEPSPYYQMLPGHKTPGGRTLNYKFMAWVGAWAWYALKGKTKQAELFRTQVKGFLRDDREIGHMTYEQSCPDPHHGMHAGAAGVGYLLATRLEDDEMQRAFARWWFDHLSIGDACSDPHGVPAVPCMRAKEPSGPFSKIWTYCNQSWQGLAITDPPSAEAVNGDRWWLGVRCWLSFEGFDLIKPPEEFPVLLHPMTVQRWGNKDEGGYLAWIERGVVRGQPAKVQEPIDWVLSRWSNGPTIVDYGRSWETPVPKLEVGNADNVRTVTSTPSAKGA